MLPTSDAVRAIGARLLGPELLLFPVRHHSPACAWQLQRLFGVIRPSVVLIEGPRSFTSLLPMLVHDETRMPLAIYSYAVGKAQGDEMAPRHAAYYPFCDHSPELVALQAAFGNGIPARFIDLNFAEQCQIEPPVDAPPGELVRAVKKLAEARVKLLGLASLDAEANPVYDRAMAERLAACGMEIAALTPQRLAHWLVKVIS